MFYDCKVLNPDGTLKHIITAKEQQAQSDKKCLTIFSNQSRQYLEGFDTDIECVQDYSFNKN